MKGKIKVLESQIEKLKHDFEEYKKTGHWTRRDILTTGLAGLIGLSLPVTAQKQQELTPSQLSSLSNPRSASYTIAAYDAPQTWKNTADFICDGINDEAEIQQALNLLIPLGGKIILSEGRFNISTSITYSSHITIQGMGFDATKLIKQQDIILFRPSITNQLRFYISDLTLQGLGKGMGNTALLSMFPTEGVASKYLSASRIRLYSSGGHGIMVPPNTIGVYLEDIFAYELTGSLIHKAGNGATTCITLLNCIASHGGRLAYLYDVSGLNIIGGGGDYWDGEILEVFGGGVVQGLQLENPQGNLNINPIKLGGSQNLIFAGNRLLSLGSAQWSPIWWAGWGHGSIIRNNYFFNSVSEYDLRISNDVEGLCIKENFTTGKLFSIMDINKVRVRDNWEGIGWRVE